jgi:hypothetical protein
MLLLLVGAWYFRMLLAAGDACYSDRRLLLMVSAVVLRLPAYALC